MRKTEIKFCCYCESERINVLFNINFFNSYFVKCLNCKKEYEVIEHGKDIEKNKRNGVRK